MFVRKKGYLIEIITNSDSVYKNTIGRRCVVYGSNHSVCKNLWFFKKKFYVNGQGPWMNIQKKYCKIICEFKPHENLVRNIRCL